VLQQLSGREVVNAGIPGEVSAEGVVRLAETLEEIKPQLLILCLGGNDMLRQRSVTEIEQNLEKMVTMSREQGVQVLLLGVPRPAIFGLKSADLYYSLAERLQLQLEAEIIPEVLSDSGLKSDQIHPNTEGYRLLAEGVFNKLKTSGAL
jgi:lysophospholipase L1-like esterase